MLKKPDVEKITRDLKDFQRETVDYVFSRLYRDDNAADRFLIADEVGLGKTLEARGVIAKAIDHLWADRSRIDVIYVCANSDIAQQNINRLNVTGEREFSFATRVTFLPLEIQDLKNNRINFVSFTPGTSFDLKSKGGKAKERIMLYHLLRDGWEFGDYAGPKNLFQVGVKDRRDWRRRLKNFDKSRIDEDLKAAFIAELNNNPEYKNRFENLVERYSHYREKYPSRDRSRRNEFIGDLRQLLAETCINELRPDLIIMDEFQKFKYLLEGEDEIAKLAHTLFEYGQAKILLLSATPYKMYTMYHEEHDDNHYEDLMRTVKFLFDDEEKTAEFKKSLRSFRENLYEIENLGKEKIKRSQKNIKNMLSGIMVRNERVNFSRDHNAMIEEEENGNLDLSAEEVNSFAFFDRVAEVIGTGNMINYWKSAPYLLNFMDRGYKVKEKFAEVLEDPEKTEKLKELVQENSSRLLDWDKIYNYEAVDFKNAKVEAIVKENIDNGAWQLLWIPPSMPYYDVSSGPYGNEQLKPFTKSLVFSAWRMVPRVVSMLCSYEAERKMINNYSRQENYRDIWSKSRVQLLRFGFEEDRPANMTNFTLLYPCLTLAKKIDLCEIGRNVGERNTLPGENDTFQAVKRKIQKLVKPVIDDYGSRSFQGKEDVNWYWAAMVLLDKEHFEGEVKTWFNEEVNEAWEEMLDGQEEEETAFESHLNLLKKVFFTEDYELGPVPSDIYDVLVNIAMGSPGIIAFRSFEKIINEEIKRDSWQRLQTSSARVAMDFRTLFNLPDSSYMIRGLDIAEDSRYWEAVLDYCINGNLQAVMDEYLHVVRETNGLTNKKSEYIIDKITDELEEVLTVKTNPLQVDIINSDHDEIELDSKRIRCKYAMRFGDNPSEDGKKTRASQIRKTFNSPFKPFILATTSIGQEGLDFHLYCHKIYHWNLPANPVDLEQREGRIHRYKGHAIRRNAAHDFNVISSGLRCNYKRDPWDVLFEKADSQKSSEYNDIVPFWIYNKNMCRDNESSTEKDNCNIKRMVPILPYSREVSKLNYLKETLGAYRIVFGQPRQEDLLKYLNRHAEKLDGKDLIDLKIDLSPYNMNE